MKKILIILTILLFSGCSLLQLPDSTQPDEPLIGGDKDKGGCLIGAGYQWCEVNQKCQRLWEEPCLENKDFDSNLIKDAFSKKYPEWDLSTWKVNVERQFDKFATGGVSPMEEDIGGGYFFAVNTDDGWVIAADGNGVIECQQIEPYDFPSDLIGECWDTVNNIVVER
ncbi:hypothetical protein JW758_00245 [Candidatus Peregrinibacteria bacterium]|nr:hypothetical protein [Candidatus Peregrinibacteria bacterium]